MAVIGLSPGSTSCSPLGVCPDGFHPSRSAQLLPLILFPFSLKNSAHLLCVLASGLLMNQGCVLSSLADWEIFVVKNHGSPIWQQVPEGVPCWAYSQRRPLPLRRGRLQQGCRGVGEHIRFSTGKQIAPNGSPGSNGSKQGKLLSGGNV